jgi:hypothetical protein
MRPSIMASEVDRRHFAITEFVMAAYDAAKYCCPKEEREL